MTALALELNQTHGIRNAHLTPEIRALLNTESRSDELLQNLTLLTLNLRARRQSAEPVIPLVRTLREHLNELDLKTLCLTLPMTSEILTQIQANQPEYHPHLIIIHAALEVIACSAGTSEAARLAGGAVTEVLEKIRRSLINWNPQHPGDPGRVPEGAPLPPAHQPGLGALCLTPHNEMHLMFSATKDIRQFEMRGSPWPRHPCAELNTTLSRVNQLRLNQKRRDYLLSRSGDGDTDLYRFPLALQNKDERILTPEQEVNLLSRAWSHLQSRQQATSARRRSEDLPFSLWLGNVPVFGQAYGTVTADHQREILNLTVLMLALTPSAGLASEEQIRRWRDRLAQPRIPVSSKNAVLAFQQSLIQAELLLSHLHRLDKPEPELQRTLMQLILSGEQWLDDATAKESRRRRRLVNQFKADI